VRRVKQRVTGQFHKVLGPARVVVPMAGWMPDPVICAGMTLGATRVDLAALVELQRLLIGAINPAQCRSDIAIVAEESNAVSQTAGSGAGSATDPVFRNTRLEGLGSTEWDNIIVLGLDPDLRLQAAIRLIFLRFHELGGARQVLLSMKADQIHFPRPSDEGRTTSFEWTPIHYRHVIAILKTPIYAYVYVYAKSEKHASIVDGMARRNYGQGKPIGTWEVMIKDHHQGYICWVEYERNQNQLALNNYGRAGGVKSDRDGKALLCGVMICRRCGRRLSVAYTGNPQSRQVYCCHKPNILMGLPRCMPFGGPPIDAAVSRELLMAVEPMAIDAEFEAERKHQAQQEDQQRILEMELQQARDEASLAERRYAACDPDNRLIAAQLEQNWETALLRVQDLEMRRPSKPPSDIEIDPSAFANLTATLSAAWHAPNGTMRAR
jgi:hypothetical protein